MSSAVCDRLTGMTDFEGAARGASVSVILTDGEPGSGRMVCIHASPTFVTEWLE